LDTQQHNDVSTKPERKEEIKKNKQNGKKEKGTAG
jgi:hypothetical protein